MPHPLGRTKVGGRAKGTLNKKTVILEDKCLELEVDPFEILLLFAKGDWKKLGYDDRFRVKGVTESGENLYEDVISAELRAQCAKEACQYLLPKRKAIEIGNMDDEGFKVILEDYTKG